MTRSILRLLKSFSQAKCLPDVVLLTEATIAITSPEEPPGATPAASSLKEAGIATALHATRASVGMGVVKDPGPEHIDDLLASPSWSSGRKAIVIGCHAAAPFTSNLLISAASQLLESRGAVPCPASRRGDRTATAGAPLEVEDQLIPYTHTYIQIHWMSGSGSCTRARSGGC